MDVSFILCLAVTHQKALSGWGWGPGHLSWTVHSLGPDPRPACTLTLCPFSCPRVFQAHHVDDKPAEESTRAAQKEFGLWEDTGQSPANEGKRSMHKHRGPGQGQGAGGWWQQTCTERFMGVRLDSFPPQSNPVGMLIFVPILHMGKLRCRERNDLYHVIQLENGSTGSQSHFSKVPLCLRLRKTIRIPFYFTALGMQSSGLFI